MKSKNLKKEKEYIATLVAVFCTLLCFMGCYFIYETFNKKEYPEKKEVDNSIKTYLDFDTFADYVNYKKNLMDNSKKTDYKVISLTEDSESYFGYDSLILTSTNDVYLKAKEDNDINKLYGLDYKIASNVIDITIIKVSELGYRDIYITLNDGSIIKISEYDSFENGSITLVKNYKKLRSIVEITNACNDSTCGASFKSFDGTLTN